VTAIVGVEHKGKVYIGGDSAGSDGWRVSIRADEKVFVRQGAEDFTNGGARSVHPMVFGFTTSFRMGQLLRYSLKIPTMPSGADEMDKWMVTDFIDAVRQCLKDGGFASKTDEEEVGGTFLVGTRGSLYFVGSDYQVGRAVDGYDAVGCGEDYALGALHALRETGTKASTPGPEAQINAALEAASHHSTGVAGPYLVLSA
jgi:ATP-dependent protease HslVU (ClpYQ) peptidase subunit